MAEQGFRPRYKFLLDRSPDELRDAIVAHGKSANPNKLIIRKVRGHLVINIPNESRHFWSPHMDVNLEIDELTGQTMVRCLIGPSPTVWTLFMFFYGFFGFMSFVGLTLGLSQWTLKKPMWGFWVLPVAAIGMGVMYFISYEGKKLSHDEMHQLKGFVDEALGCDCLDLADDFLKAPNNSIVEQVKG